MKMLMPSHAKRVQPYKDQGVPLFHRFQVESQLDAMLNPVVQLKSGGYLVINPTEALVAVDVNSGRSTRERNIEETAYKTNLEAAEELARQLRLRDLAGLIVVDFIDMEDHRNQASVERKLKEAMRNDRARLQIGRISPFGLLEMSRQRLRPSLVESAFEVCTHCRGVGLVRSIESAALHLLRVIEEEGMRRRSGALTVHVASEVALYILNRKRDSLGEIENRYGFSVMIFGDDSLISPDHRIERTRAKKGDEVEEVSAVLNTDSVSLTAIENPVEPDEDEVEVERDEDDDQGGKRRRRRRRRRGRNDDRDDRNTDPQQEASDDNDDASDTADRNDNNDDDDDENNRKRRRRGKRGGRRRSRRQDFDANRTRSPADDPALTAARRNRDHEAPDGTAEDTVIDADSEGQEADSFDQEGVRVGRVRSTTAPAPARPRRDRNDNRRNRRDRNNRSDRNTESNDRDVKNIPIQSGPAPEATSEAPLEAKPEAAAAPATAPAEVSAPAPKKEAPKAEAPKAEVPAEKPAEPKAAEPAKAEKAEPAPAPAPETAPAAEPAKDEKPKPKKRGWWSLGR
jgi:ribonuclease E